MVIELTIFDNLLDLLIGEAEEHVFGFQVCVDNFAYPVEEVKSD